MARKALVVAGAAGSDEEAGGVLGRFGFSSPATAPHVDAALEQLRRDRFDLLVVPLEGITGLQLAALEREARRGPTYVIGTGPKLDSELILRAMRAGIQEFLVYPPEPTDLAAAVDRLVRRQHSEAQRGRVVSVYGSKGGAGVTTVAVNLAFASARARADARVAIADLVPVGGDVRVLLNLKPAYDVGDLARNLERVDAELLHSLLTTCAEGVWALPSSEQFETEEVLDAAAVTTIVEQLRLHYAMVVLDCDHALTDRTLAALDVSDRIVVVTQLDVASLRGTQRALALLRRLAYPPEKLAVVVNRHGSEEVLSVSDASEVLEADVFWRLPNDYPAAAGALNQGMPIVTHAPDSKLAQSYLQLAGQLLGATAPAPGVALRTNGSRLRRLFRLRKRT